VFKGFFFLPGMTSGHL